MAKVKTPLLSFDARRKLGDDIVFTRRRQVNIVETTPKPYNVRSLAQLSWRHMFLKVVSLWHALSAAEKEAWESLGRRRHMTGYAWFVSQALRPNPGIYLPLQGGTMTGEILMGTNSIKGLPLPTGTGHAARKSYVDGRVSADILTHKGDASAHHIRYSDAEAVAAVEAAGLSNFVWKDTPTRPLSVLNQNTSIAWTDLDLTAHTSADAKLAILNLIMHLDSYSTGSIRGEVRKNGTTPGFMHVGTVWATDEAPPDDYNTQMVIVGLDSGQVIEYANTKTGTAQWDFWITVLGYIE